MTTSNGTAHDSNQVAGEVLQNTPAVFDSVACPVPSTGYQLRQTKLRLLRKSFGKTKTPLKPPTCVTANDAPNGATEWANPANNSCYQPTGVWNECARCKKWRFFAPNNDPSETPCVWDSSLRAKWRRVGVRGRPRREEKENLSKQTIGANSGISSGFSAGSVVWAKMSGLVWWPAMVDFDGKGMYADYDPVTHKATHYWVVSLDPHGMTAERLPAPYLRKYVHGALIDETLRKSKHWSRIKKAIKVAEDALKLPIRMRIEIYGYSASKKRTNVSLNGTSNKQGNRKTHQIKHKKGDNPKNVSHRFQGGRKSDQEAIMGGVGAPLVGKAVPTRSRRLPSAYKISKDCLTRGVPPNAGGGSTCQESSPGTTFCVSPNCLSKCTPPASSRKTNLGDFNDLTRAFGLSKMIFYKPFFATDFLEGHIPSREEERNCGSCELTVEEAMGTRTACDDTTVHPLSTLDSCRGRSTSLVDFLKGAINSKLEERASMISDLSAIITNLPFHRQLKAAKCHACSFK